MAELSRRYAAALFELSRDKGALDPCFEQAFVLRDILQTDECRGVLEHPHISPSEKRAFLSEAFSGKLNEQLQNFMSLLITKNRASIMISSLTAFIDMVHHARGRIEARVVSATALDEGQIRALGAVLSKKLHKEVDILLEVDPSLIGGFRVHVDGRFMDYTIQRQLADLKNCMKNGGRIG